MKVNIEEFDAYLYDITLDNHIVRDQGNAYFDTKDEAREDAEEYIKSELISEYNRKFEDFKIECYVGTIVN